jgi:hypothetical protein
MGFEKEIGRASNAGMKHLALVLSAFAAIAFWPDAGAQNVSRSAVCTADNSAKADIAAIASAPAAWIGRCVVVDGLYSDERVYRDVDAIYGVSSASVGGYIDGLGQLPGAWRGSFVGRVSDCAEAEETLLASQLRAPGISLHGRVLGCAKPDGPFLMFMSTTGEFGPSGLRRRMPGGKGGDLQPATQDWAHLQAATQRAEAFAAAMRSGDAAQLGAVLNDAYRAQLLLGSDDSALSMLRGGGGLPTVFVDRDTGADSVAAEACWCRQRACDRLWPIDSRDADNRPERAYACLRVEGVLRDGQWRYRSDASHDVAGLQEP